MIRKITYFVSLFSILFFILLPSAYAEEKAKSASASFTASASASSPAFIYKGHDSRVEALRRFLEQRNSPLTPDAQAFVEEADKNNIDWKLVTAISGVES